MPRDVCEPAAEREQHREGQQVRVDDPLRPGRRQAEIVLQTGIASATIVWSINVIATAKIIAARISCLLRDPRVRDTSFSRSERLGLGIPPPHGASPQ